MKMPDLIDVQGGPISLVFSKGGRAFFSERVTGNLWEITGEEKYLLLKHFPIAPVTGHNETGLLGIALDPEFETNGYLYAYYTAGKNIDTAANKIVRIKVGDEKEETLLSDIPAGRIHNGGIMKFGPDGKLYIGVGVHNEEMQRSQDKEYLGGKILRINSGGSVPGDNPINGSPVYSWGHRNIFGLAFHPKTKKLYISDVGPEKNDEVNIIEPGGNYGWPDVTGVVNDPKYIDPIVTYTPTITPTQNVFVGSDLYFGAYNEGTVHKLTLTEDGSKVLKDTIVYQGKPFGITGVFVSSEGEFFVTTTSRILKIEPDERSGDEK